MTALAVIADLVAVTGGWAIAVVGLGVPSQTYIQKTTDQVKFLDFSTGIGKGTVFGLLIGLIACTNGLRVTGGAAGVGRATTSTVVQSIVAIIVADLMFTAVFYSVGWV